ncbi:hypothetical protein [Burkholderia lata]|uniref:hypothetical protein n=1 Tax=Burkholderia lata (strain ATCC 17760 / DSM 23089 / LMG 22485 / NCIMB 9086 / R18194 / 383) TaxID=482957 RepID=UPI003F689D55
MLPGLIDRRQETPETVARRQPLMNSFPRVQPREFTAASLPVAGVVHQSDRFMAEAACHFRTRLNDISMKSTPPDRNIPS